ncbi:hypothetical protein T265_13712, partial [Opisthorchis viverrini]
YRPNSVARNIGTQYGYAEQQVITSDLPPELRYIDALVKTHIENELKTLKGQSKGNEPDKEPDKASILVKRERLVKQADEQFLIHLREFMDKTPMENEVEETEDSSAHRTSNQSIQVAPDQRIQVTDNEICRIRRALVRHIELKGTENILSTFDLTEWESNCQ